MSFSMKISTSCIQCRAGKRKCVVEAQGLSCQHCLKQKKQCSFRRSPLRPTRLLPHAQRKQQTVSTSSELCIQAIGETLDTVLEATLIDLYLSLIHDKPHTLFNPNMLRKRLRDETLPRSIIYSIMALAARYVTWYRA